MRGPRFRTFARLSCGLGISLVLITGLVTDLPPTRIPRAAAVAHPQPQPTPGLPQPIPVEDREPVADYPPENVVLNPEEVPAVEIPNPQDSTSRERSEWSYFNRSRWSGRVPSLPGELRGGPANVYVYYGARDGKNVYVGITSDVVRRQAQHGDRFILQRLPMQPVTRGQARAIEEALIVRNPEFVNLRHSISPTHPWYQQAVDWGEAWLHANGL